MYQVVSKRKNVKRTLAVFISIAALIGMVFAVQQTDAASGKIAKVKKVKLVERVGDKQYKISWKKVSGAKKYSVQEVKKRSNKKPKVLKKYKKTSKTKLTVKSKSSSTRKKACYRVRALKGKSKGRFSKVLCFNKTVVDDEENKDEEDKDKEEDTSSVYDKYSDLVGSYSGTWDEIAFGAASDVPTTFVITKASETSLQVEIDFGIDASNVGADLGGITLLGTLEEAGITFTATGEHNFGPVTSSFDPTTGMFEFESEPPSEYALSDFTVTADFNNSSAVTGTSSLTHVGGVTGKGEITAAKN